MSQNNENDRKHLLGLFGPEDQHGGDVWGASRKLGIPVEKVLDLSASLNPLGPPPGLVDVIQDAVGRMCHYPDRRSYELRQAIADKMGVNRVNVLPGNGSTSVIRLMAKSLDLHEIFILAPAFGEFRRGFASSGRHFHFHQLSEAAGFTVTRHDIDALLEKDPSAVVLTNPSTPAGALSNTDDLEYLLEQAHRRRIWVILDEAFIDFAPEEARNWSAQFVGKHPRLIVMRSMTKFYCLAGLRLGFALGDRHALAELLPLSEPWSVNTLAQEAGIYCLDQDEFGDQTRDAVNKWREQQAKMLTGLGLHVLPSAVNYLLCKLPGAGPNAAAVAASCFEKGILVRDASNFNGCNKHHLRLAVTTPENQERIAGALKEALGI